MTFWIAPFAIDEKDRAAKTLEEIGVVVGQWHEGEGEWKGCVVSDDAMDRLDRFWMNFLLWGPERGEQP